MAALQRSGLQRDLEPKLAWAMDHREHFPVDVNCAPRELLERIPGFGVRTIDRILQTRRRRAICAADLRKLRLDWHRLRYFVATVDYQPRRTAEPIDRLSERQAELF